MSSSTSPAPSGSPSGSPRGSQTHNNIGRKIEIEMQPFNQQTTKKMEGARKIDVKGGKNTGPQILKGLGLGAIDDKCSLVIDRVFNAGEKAELTRWQRFTRSHTILKLTGIKIAGAANGETTTGDVVVRVHRETLRNHLGISKAVLTEVIKKKEIDAAVAARHASITKIIDCFSEQQTAIQQGKFDEANKHFDEGIAAFYKDLRDGIDSELKKKGMEITEEVVAKQNFPLHQSTARLLFQLIKNKFPEASTGLLLAQKGLLKQWARSPENNASREKANDNLTKAKGLIEAFKNEPTREKLNEINVCLKTAEEIKPFPKNDYDARMDKVMDYASAMTGGTNFLNKKALSRDLTTSTLVYDLGNLKKEAEKGLIELYASDPSLIIHNEFKALTEQTTALAKEHEEAMATHEYAIIQQNFINKKWDDVINALCVKGNTHRKDPNKKDPDNLWTIANDALQLIANKKEAAEQARKASEMTAAFEKDCASIKAHEENGMRLHKTGNFAGAREEFIAAFEECLALDQKDMDLSSHKLPEWEYQVKANIRVSTAKYLIIAWEYLKAAKVCEEAEPENSASAEKIQQRRDKYNGLYTKLKLSFENYNHRHSKTKYNPAYAVERLRESIKVENGSGKITSQLLNSTPLTVPF